MIFLFLKDRTKFLIILFLLFLLWTALTLTINLSLTSKKVVYLKNLMKVFARIIIIYDDMRLLKNIYNEFIVYYNRLNITELDCNKMLAIIAYKNLFPRDFANLQLNQGFIYTIFDKKNEFVETEIEKSIDERKQRISSGKEKLVSIRELNTVFVSKYLSSNGYRCLGKSDSELSDYVMGSLYGSEKEEYMHRKQILNDKLSKNNEKLQKEICELEYKKN